MISALSLADKDGVDVPLMNTTGREVISIHGLAATGAVRENRRVKPQKRGAIDESSFDDGVLIDAQFEVTASTHALALADFRTMTAPMRQTLKYGAAALKWTEYGGLSLQRMVKLAGEIDPPFENNSTIIAWQSQLFSEDPRAFSQTQTTYTGAALSTLGGGLTFPFTFPFTFASSGGGTVTATNAGTDDTPPVFRIYGSCENPQIVNLDTQERMVFGSASTATTIASGSYLEVDVAAGTVKLNGTTASPSLIDSSLSTWFELSPGVNNLQMIATAFDSDARLDVLVRAAY